MDGKSGYMLKDLSLKELKERMPALKRIEQKYEQQRAAEKKQRAAESEEQVE